MSTESKPHSDRDAAFRDWAMADSNPKSNWLIDRQDARRIFEQLESLRFAVEAFCNHYPEHPGANYSDADTEFVLLGHIRGLRNALNPAKRPSE